MKKTHVLFLFGGHPDEHRASVVSAANILPFFNPEKYELHLVYIATNGEWILCDREKFNTGCDNADAVMNSIAGRPVMAVVGQRGGARLMDPADGKSIPVDVVFSALTGKLACDGSIQGFFRVADIPLAGPSILSAAIGFDKDVMKRLLIEAGLPVCRYRNYCLRDMDAIRFDALARDFGIPFIIKPPNSGSSIGVHKIRGPEEFPDAVRDVFRYDDKLMAEEYIKGSELELYCLDVDNEIRTTIIRETVVRGDDFWSYESKYVTDNVDKYVPARIDEETARRVVDLTRKAYRVLEGRGLARMDFFLSVDGRLLINEINTAPVFMSHSNQPPLWELSGISYAELVDMMIQEAVKRAGNTKKTSG